MRIIIVGNGIAGVMSAKILRDLGSDAEITLYSEEKYHYYPRPNLIEYMAGTMNLQRLFPFADSWYAEKKIGVHLGKGVSGIEPGDRRITLHGGGGDQYDALLLANGARSALPPIRGLDKKGIHTVRTLDDCQALLEEVKKFGRATILGGGLLGLEIARALRSRGAEVQVIEYFDRLLWRQLDEEASALLQSQIEDMGIQVRCGMACTDAEGNGRVRSLSFKNGLSLPTDLVVIAAGIRPDIELARTAGLETDRGVVVDRFLSSSLPDIYAAGDLVQHRDRIYGIIPASFEQARTAAHNLMGNRKAYEGTIPSNTLKIMGLTVTSVGVVNPAEEGFEEIKSSVAESGIYKKIVLRQDRIVGAIWMGTKRGAAEIAKLIGAGADIALWKNTILDEDFDFSQVGTAE
jgi:nitrite reductase (NADH) large subunit